MAVSLKPKFGNDVELTFVDNQGVELVVVGDMDNLALDNLLGTLNQVVWAQSRGKPTGKGHSTWAPVTGSFGFEVRQLTSASTRIIVDWIQHKGACASLESTAGPGTEDVWSWHIKVKIKGLVEHGDDADHEFTLRNLHATSFSYADGTPSSFTLGFEAESVDGDLTCLAVGDSPWGA